MAGEDNARLPSKPRLSKLEIGEVTAALQKAGLT
jgi:hypothetical protein